MLSHWQAAGRITTVVALVAGCSGVAEDRAPGSPVELPSLPVSVSPSVEPVLERWHPFSAELIRLVADGAGRTTLTAQPPGALPAPTGSVTAVNLDRPDQRGEATVDSGGGFSITLGGAPTDRFRLLGRSKAFAAFGLLQSDVTRGSDGDVGVNVEKGHCVLGYSAVQVAFEDVAAGQRAERTARVTNRCSDDIELSAPSVLGEQHVAHIPEFAPTRLQPGEWTELTIVFAPQTEGDALAFVSVEVGPDHARHVVTVVGSARAGPD